MRHLRFFFSLFLVAAAFFHSKAQASLIESFFVWQRTSENADFNEKLRMVDSILNGLPDTREGRFVKGRALCAKGSVLTQLGRYEESATALIESGKQTQRVNDEVGSAATLLATGILYYTIAENEEGAKYYKEALGKYLRLNTSDHSVRVGLINSTFNLAQLYFDSDSMDLCRKMLDSSEAFARRFDDREHLAYVLAMRGSVEFDEEQYENSLERHSQALELARNLGLRDLEGNEILNIGLCLMYLNKNEQAEKQMQLALEIAYEQQHVPLIQRCAEGLFLLYERSREATKALEYLKIMMVFNDSMLDHSKTRALIDAEKKYRGEEKQKALTQEKLRVENRTRLIWVLVILSLVLSVLIAAAIRNRNQVKLLAAQEKKLAEFRLKEMERESELKMAESQLAGQEEERKRIATELHDRVGSLLSTAKLSLSDEEAKPRHLLDQAVEEVRRISHDLHAVSLIRQGFDPAIREHIESIRHKGGPIIHYFNHVDDRAIYQACEIDLFRICQELFNNSLKYARATEIHLQLNRDVDKLLMIYEDNGIGFDVEAALEKKGLGLLSIQNRVKKCNGICYFESRPGQGMTFTFERDK